MTLRTAVRGARDVEVVDVDLAEVPQDVLPSAEEHEASQPRHLIPARPGSATRRRSRAGLDQRSANPQVATTVGAAEQPALHPELPRYVDGTEDETHHAVHDHNEMGEASLRLSLDG